MRTVLAIASAAAMLAGCAIAGWLFSMVQGDGKVVREQRAVGTVQGLDVGGSMVVDVQVGPAASLAVEADSNILPLIHADMRGDTLVVSSEGSYSTHHPVHIIYTTPRLTELRHGGSGKLRVEGLNGAPLSVHQGGSGALVLSGQVRGDDAGVGVSGRRVARAASA